jgi:hypothetical protein
MVVIKSITANTLSRPKQFSAPLCDLYIYRGCFSLQYQLKRAQNQGQRLEILRMVYSIYAQIVVLLMNEWK